MRELNEAKDPAHYNRYKLSFTRLITKDQKYILAIY